MGCCSSSQPMRDGKSLALLEHSHQPSLRAYSNIHSNLYHSALTGEEGIDDFGAFETLEDQEEDNLFHSSLENLDDAARQDARRKQKRQRPPDNHPEGAALNNSERLVYQKMKEGAPDEVSRVSEELIVRIIRGYPPDKTVEALKRIVEWRETNNMDTILRQKLLLHDQFNEKWPSILCGTDHQGHIIQMEQVSKIDATGLVKMMQSGTTLDEILAQRSQVNEMVDTCKKRLSDKTGRRRYKHVVILDLEGFSSDLLKQEVRNILQPVFKIGGENYPEALYKMFLINCGWSFQLAWKVISPWVHPVTRQKLKIVGGRSAYITAFKEAGLDVDALPPELGGTFHPHRIADLISQNADSISSKLEDSFRPTLTLTSGTEISSADDGHEPRYSMEGSLEASAVVVSS